MRAVPDDQGVPLEQGQAGSLEGRQAQGVGQLEGLVAQDREREVESLGHLLLVRGVLRREAEDAGAGRDERAMPVAIGAGLRRAAAGTGDRIPAASPPGGSSSGRPVRG